jgi:4-deoxy-L-threo-5-hexosulose-uronate ketol-isomerase
MIRSHPPHQETPVTETHIPQRYATNPAQIPGMTTRQLRDTYLIPDVFVPGEIRLTYTHHDRVVLGGAVPAGAELRLTGYPEIRSETFLEHRELGVVNVGGEGVVVADGEEHTLVTGACLYLGRGVEEGTVRELGDQLTSNRRTLNQYIHENGIQSCQIVMGVTELHPGSMWNTMPAHTHDRRTECYLYFDVPEDARVVHLMGEREETRHLLVADRQAVISPSWSLHSGVGSAAYSFVWAMAGENQAFDDMDAAPITDLR